MNLTPNLFNHTLASPQVDKNARWHVQWARRVKELRPHGTVLFIILVSLIAVIGTGCESKESRIQTAIDIVECKNPPSGSDGSDIFVTRIGSEIFVMYKDRAYETKFIDALKELERSFPASAEALEKTVSVKIDPSKTKKLEDVQTNAFTALRLFAKSHPEAKQAIERLDARVQQLNSGTKPAGQ